MTAIEWTVTVCCAQDIRIIQGAPELVTLGDGRYFHRLDSLCFTQKYEDRACPTCRDAGTVARIDTGALVPCPSHCEAGWEYLHDALDGPFQVPL